MRKGSICLYTGIMAWRRGRLKLILQLLPVILVAVAGIIGAAQLDVVRQFLAGASGTPANIVVDTRTEVGPLTKPWRNMAQGGEMSDWRIEPIKGKVQALGAEYIRLDHIYSFYDIVQKEGDQLRFNFAKLDPLIDDIVAVGAKPYIALSYMPATIASDGQITSPPARWEDWQETVRATIQHYSGDKKIANIIYEVWNEPDLFGGYKTYGDRNYLTLYSYADRGQKQVRNAQPYKFGGPAITALYKNWFDTLTQQALKNGWRLDFFSWHRYNKDVEQFRKDFQQANDWKAANPALANLELHITEYGHDSANHPGYDTNMGAAHTAATSIEMVNRINRAFVFEVEDGKDPKGQERWGRWGVLTHHDFGANIKPRYLAIRLMNRINGNVLQLTGKGTWVKALATRNGFFTEMLLANYDQFGTHVENVPIKFNNIIPGNYDLEITDLGGASRKLQLATTEAVLATSVFMPANSVMYLRLVPNLSIPTESATPIAPTP